MCWTGIDGHMQKYKHIYTKYQALLWSCWEIPVSFTTSHSFSASKDNPIFLYQMHLECHLESTENQTQKEQKGETVC